MKINGTLAFNLSQILFRANSTRGQARQFIRTNRRRFAEAANVANDWLISHADEYPEFTVVQGMGGESVNFDLSKGTEGFNEWNKWLREQELDIDVYRVTERAFADIEGISVEDEDLLYFLSTEFEKESKKEEVGDDEGSEVVEQP